MNRITNYPLCYKSFISWLSLNPRYERIYQQIGCPTAFDVSLRDGIQGLTKDEQVKLTTNDKISLYNKIYRMHQPKNIEFGSVVSKKVLPVFADSLDLYNYASSLTLNNLNYKYNNNNDNNINKFMNTENWILVPNEIQFNQLQSYCSNSNLSQLPNISLITSASESFQMKNTKMSIDESLAQIQNILVRIDDSTSKNVKTKVYLSCINECPIEGHISINKIIDTIKKINMLKPDMICLSDTCGTLDINTFRNLMIHSLLNGIPRTKYGLHLHVKKGNEVYVENIIKTALDWEITNFDVSILETGGCSVTMKKTDLAPNLSYELFYKALTNYIIEKDEDYRV